MSRPKLWRLLLLAAITLVAAFFRLYKIDSLPPSAGYDQAAYGMDALSILDGARPIFLPTHLGREVLFSYLVTLCYVVIRDLPTAVYATSALIGVLTIPAVYLVADEMFSLECGALKQFGGLLSALVVAVSHWHVSWSRLGMRVVLVPLVLSIALYFLWRGLRAQGRAAFAASGFFLGLGMYTYQAFRIAPLLVLFVFAYVSRSRRSWSRRDLLNLALLSIVAIAVFAPLGYYFVTHSGSASWAIKEALVLETSRGWLANARTLLNRALETLLALSVRGDQDPRVTIPGRPALDPFLSAAFATGIGVGLFHLKKPLYPSLLTWVAVMSVPAVLAGGGATTKRAFGATPAVAMLIAIGCLVSWDSARRWAERRRTAWPKRLVAALAVLLTLGFAYSGVRTYLDYFVLWSQDPGLFTHFEAGASAIGLYVKERPPDERIYISPVPADHPSIGLYSGRRQGLKTYHGRFCLVLPRPVVRNTTYVIVTGEDRNSLDLLQAIFPQGEVVGTGPLHYGQPYFLAYGVPAGAEARVMPSHERQVNWDDKVQLWGFDLDDAAYKAGETIHVTLYYGAAGEMTAEYTVFTHLLGPNNPATGSPVWGQDDSEPCRGIYPTSVWEPGELVIDHFSLSIPPEAPAGAYQIEVGIYNWWTMERLPVLDAAGSVAGDHIILNQIRVTER